MPYLAATEGLYGYWGNGDDEQSAIANCRKVGGQKPTVLLVISEDYRDPYIDDFGRVLAWLVTPEKYEGTSEPFPPMVVEKWSIGAKGQRKKQLA